MSLPTPWRISKATVTPEVHTTVREGERRWVASGETRHIIVDPPRRLRADLVVKVVPGASRRRLAPLAEPAAAGPIAVHGHPGEFQLGRQRGGWWPSRRLVPTLRVRHYCAQTSRTILLEVSGAIAVEELRGLLRAMEDMECHGPLPAPASDDPR